METLQRTKSDISTVLLHTKHCNDPSMGSLPTLSEIEIAKCECCGMTEECTAEYIEEMRDKYSGKYGGTYQVSAYIIYSGISTKSLN